MAVLIAAAALSLAAQVAQASPAGCSPSSPPWPSWPLTKLLFSRTPAHPRPPHHVAAASTDTMPATATGDPPKAPESDQADDTLVSELLVSARMAAFAHHQATGQAITPRSWPAT